MNIINIAHCLIQLIVVIKLSNVEENTTTFEDEIREILSKLEVNEDFAKWSGFTRLELWLIIIASQAASNKRYKDNHIHNEVLKNLFETRINTLNDICTALETFLCNFVYKKGVFDEELLRMKIDFFKVLRASLIIFILPYSKVPSGLI